MATAIILLSFAKTLIKLTYVNLIKYNNGCDSLTVVRRAYKSRLYSKSWNLMNIHGIISTFYCFPGRRHKNAD